MIAAPTDPFIPEAFDAVLVDMDGVLIFGPNRAAGALELVRRSGARLVVVTNESQRSRHQLARDFAERGLPLAPAQIVTAGERAIRLLAQDHRDACILIRGAPILHDMAAEAGLREWTPGDKADLVLLARDPDFDIDALSTMTRAVEDGAKLWVTNPDLRHPIGNGRHTFQTGALLAALTACVGDIPVHIVGKPSPGLFTDALALRGASPDKAVMLGDTAATDGAGAREADIPFILIGPSPGADAADIAQLLRRR